MIINLAEHYGFCFGVSRAIKLCEDAAADGKIYSYGSIIHNEEEVNRLEKLGVQVRENIEDIPDNSVTLIRSHGVAKHVYDKLESKNCIVIDATCPYVKKLHKIIDKATKENRNIILLGKKTHPEIIGASGWGENVLIFSDMEEVKSFDFKNSKYVLLAQTTLKKEFFDEAVDYLSNLVEDLTVHNTICEATKLRQDSTKEISKTNDAVIVIGSENSSNTKKLFEISKKFNKNTYLINNISNLYVKDLRKYDRIGISAGASTPNWVINEILVKLQNENEGVLHMENLSMKEMMDQTTFSAPKTNEILTGKVVMVKDDAVIVNIGYKADGVIPESEISNPENEPLEKLFEVDSEVEVLVLRRDNGEGNVLLSSKRIKSRKDWEILEEKFNNNETITVKIVEIVKGGMVATYNDIRAFIPASQFDIKYVKDLSQYIGSEFEVEFLEFKRRNNQIVLSRKSLLEKERKDVLDKFWDSLEEGKIVKGIVRRFTPYGAFVELGPEDGLVHISEIKWGKLVKPEDALNLNEELDFKIISFNREENKISLSHKQIIEDPWLSVEEKYKIGDRVDGKVVSLTHFGAFVELEEGLEGLVHVSQISEERVEHPKDVLSLNEEVVVKILGINFEERRIKLSMNQ